MSSTEGLDLSGLPQHVAIIMDGNGRWAQKRGLPRTMGHRAGMDALRATVKALDAMGIKYMTVYAFSTENWKRPEEEVGMLMSLIREYIYKELMALHRQKVRISVIGDSAQLPEDVRKKMDDAVAKTKDNPGMRFCIALNYGGREEIVRAARSLAERVQAGELLPREIEREEFAACLYTAGMPDPDLIIRTSGEMRVSNFLLWQGAYAELVVTDCLWPDFREEHVHKAIKEFQMRQRRFGGISEGS
ncbi:MAG: isoprenyl transferase [Peptococcaceae bacterium]|nr:isoprenyl transferase [Peptococcaceae bacterium]